ncbi:MAG: hypothetical protein MJH09_10390 [Cetobacterium sp.]|nr:hypothetical protein [Cetobacterium sp.]
MKIFCLTNNKRYEITSIVKDNFSWSKSIDEFSQKLEFEIINKKVSGYPINPIEIGSIIQVYNDDFLEFDGIVLANVNDSYNVVDFAFYFSKNEEIYQFNEVAANICIEEIIKSLEGPVGEIDISNVLIDKIYFEESAGSVITKIIEEIKVKSGEEFCFYYRKGQFHFKKYPIKIKNFEFNYYKKNYNLNSFFKSISRSSSIENMYNSVKIVIKNNKEDYYTETYSDGRNIKKYGIMQKIITVESEKSEDSKPIGENFLKANSKVANSLSLTIPYVKDIWDGDIIKISNEELNINGTFRIISFTKTMKEIGLELMELE